MARTFARYEITLPDGKTVVKRTAQHTAPTITAICSQPGLTVHSPWAVYSLEALGTPLHAFWRGSSAVALTARRVA